MGILFGLSAAIAWGVADFIARYSTRAIGTYRTLFFMQFFGLIALSIYLVGTGEFGRLMQAHNIQPWTIAIVASLLNILSSLALYRSFEVGILAIVSPIASSSTAITVVLAFWSGEHIGFLHTIGIFVTMLGVVLTATSFESTQLKKLTERQTLWQRLAYTGVGWALLASLGYGLLFWILGFHVIPQLGSIAPIWLVRLSTICVLAVFAQPTKQHIHLPPASVWWLLAGVGIFDTVAYVMATLGFSTGQVALVSVFASLFSAVTVLLAWIFLREQLYWSQWLGLLIIFVGIILVNV